MISNSEPGYFRALIEFERDPLPATLPHERCGAVSADPRPASLPMRGLGSAQPPVIRNSPSGGGCAEGTRPLHWDSSAPKLTLSQLEPLEAV